MVNNGFTTSVLATLLVLTALASTRPAQARSGPAQGPAGSEVTNTATLSYGDAAGVHSVASNTVGLRVLQVVDVALAADAAERPAPKPGACVVTFRLSNPGNGGQAYGLTLLSSGFPQGSERLAVGDAGAPYVAGAGDPVLAPGGSVLLTVGGDAPVATCTAKLRATAHAGHGAPGQVLPGAGVGGIDAVVGSTGGQVDVESTVPLVPAAAGGGSPAADDVVLTKNQSVRDPEGGAHAVPGAVVTYALAAQAGSAAAMDLVVTDAIPAGTAYVPGSLQLDSSTLTDAAADAAGRVDAAGVHVALGDLPASGRRVVTFQVRILTPGA